MPSRSHVRAGGSQPASQKSAAAAAVAAPLHLGGGAAELVKGYRLLRLPLAVGSPVTRSLLVKRHEARDPAEKAAARRTLFVTHLDNFVTEPQLLRCFSSGFGPVEKVELKSVEKKAPRAEQRADHVKIHVNFARIVFKEDAALEKALDAATGRIAGSAVLPLPAGELREQLRTGKAFYRDPAELRKEIDEWMAEFDAREEEKKRLAQESLVDEDGFTKVVAGITRTEDGVAIRSAKRPSLKTGAFAEPIRGTHEPEASEQKKRKGSREQPDFYRFQMREKKRQEIIDHRKRKAEDLETVEYMKKKKKFKGSQ